MIVSRLSQKANAREPISVTFVGIDIDVILEQREKDPAPIIFTLLPIITEVKFEHNIKE